MRKTRSRIFILFHESFNFIVQFLKLLKIFFVFFLKAAVFFNKPFQKKSHHFSTGVLTLTYETTSKAISSTP